MRRVRRSLLVFSLLIAVACGREEPTDTPYDLVIANGRVIDPESGLDAVRSVGIREGRIVLILDGDVRGDRTIDATGLVVVPGFIDLHEHGQDEESYAALVARRDPPDDPRARASLADSGAVDGAEGPNHDGRGRRHHDLRPRDRYRSLDLRGCDDSGRGDSLRDHCRRGRGGRR